MRRLVLGVLLALLASACAQSTVASTTVPPGATTIAPRDSTSQLGELEAARDRWAASGPADYTVSMGHACPGCELELETVAVHEGEVISLAGSEQATTVEDVFATIEGSIRDDAVVQVEYDRELGYPTQVAIDPMGDGTPEMTFTFGDLEAMPLVTTVEELREARQHWEAQELYTYRYIFRDECECPEVAGAGTFDIEVHHGRALEIRPLDQAARAGSMSPRDLDLAFDALEVEFREWGEFIDEGSLTIDVLIDPELGYPRWFRLETEAAQGNGPPVPIAWGWTIDLILPFVPIDGWPQGDPERLELERARAHWERAGLTDHRYVLTVHCECPAEFVGPFEVTVREGELASVTFQDGELADPEVILVDEAFDLIGDALDAGTDVDVTYHRSIGYPLTTIIDPEAVAVDGGLAFTISAFEPISDRGFVTGTVLAGPQCPGQQDPPRPGCEDQLVLGVPIIFDSEFSSMVFVGAVADDGTYFFALVPGVYGVSGQATKGLSEPGVVKVTVRAGHIEEIDFLYDTGIR